MKKIIFLLLTVTMFAAANAQHSPFKPIGHLGQKEKLSFGAVTATDSTFGAWRFVTNVAAYAFPGSYLMTGVGFGWQSLDYNYATQRVTCKFSISGMMWGTGSTAPTHPSAAVSYGIVAGFLNNLVMIGGAVNANKLIATVGIGISLNN